MIKRTPKSYLLLFAAILLVMSTPKTTSEKMRGLTAAFLAPAWEGIALGAISLQSYMPSKPELVTSKNAPSLSEAEIHRVQLENQQLRIEISRLQELLQNERYLNTQLSTLYSSDTKIAIDKIHREELQKLLALQFQTVPAQVIFRSPSTWSSSLWINVGKSSNQTLGREVIAKNSPVVVGTSVVGVVDYVGMHQCRVRLITDSGLTPSVRATRADPQKEHATMYLAKGELHGSSKPLWRSYGDVLKGVGFNYDFPDERGPARDLRSGMPLHGTGKEQAMPILKVNDLLVTTGMDGVFPAGLQVAEVTKIHLLKEGDYYYELEAKPTAGNLHELSLVFVMPPVGYDPNDQPPAF